MDGASGELQWNADPIDLALLASDRLRNAAGHELSTSFCVEVGRRLLRAQLEFPQWVLRRVETVSFGQGRSVLRNVAIDLKVRPDAPVFVTGDEVDGKVKELWLVPLTIMKRRTLVDFQLKSEDGTPLTLPGLRLTQALDQSMLLAAAATLEPPGEEVRTFVREVVAGERLVVAEAMRRYEADELGDHLTRLRKHPLFEMTLDRLRYNFTLYVLLSHTRGRHRLLHMSFVEPITWRYQQPQLRPGLDGWTYEPMHQVRLNLGHLASELGLTPTRVRLQIPAAEHAASYHLEVVAPPGVRIVDATMLAGRPHVPDLDRTLDSQRGDHLTVGLHGVEVPPNSLCRAQVDLRVERAGWLTTLLITTLAVLMVLLSVLVHAWFQRAPVPQQDANVIVLLITTAAAAAAFLSQRDFTGVAARLIVGMRFVGAVSMALPVVAAGLLAYGQATAPVSELEQRMPERADEWTRWGALGLSALSLALCALVFTTWRRTKSDEKGQVSSAWDQSLQANPDLEADRAQKALTYGQALERFGFDLPAVGVRSSEGWHHRYWWLPGEYRRAADDLRLLAGDRRRQLGYACAGPEDCPHIGEHGCGVQRRLAAPNAVVQPAPSASATV